MLRKLFYLIVLVLVALTSIVVLSVSDNSSISRNQTLSADDVKGAKRVANNLFQKLSSQQANLSLTISPYELNSLAALASHLTPKTEFVFNLSQPVVLMNVSTLMEYSDLRKYFNVSCLAVFDGWEVGFNDCSVGKVPLPNFLIKFIIEQALNFSLGEQQSAHLVATLNKATVTQKGLEVNLESGIAFKQQFKGAIGKVTSLTTFWSDNQEVNPESLQVYIEELNKNSGSGWSLNNSIQVAFNMAERRSVIHDPVQENTAAIWALALTNGSKQLLRFTTITDLKVQPVQSNSTLQGRRDLAQHFLYSAVLQQLGESSVALSIGQLKEMMDSDGGTGFSFVDMTANKAGMQLSNFATSNEENARFIQSKLKQCVKESCYMPSTADMQEGLGIDTFEQKYNSVSDEKYQKIERAIDQRISSLSIYQQ